MFLGSKAVPPTFNLRMCFPSLPGLAPSLERTGNRYKHSSNGITINEVEIPVPWGKIAARHWNPYSTLKPVVCVHGWRDNAASFDYLLPLLTKEWPHCQYLAVDLPGHGKSSHFPPGMSYSLPDMLVIFRRILDYFRWKNVSIIGHSMGAAYGFLFAATHPKLVEKLIGIDALSPRLHSNVETLGMIADQTKKILDVEKRLEEKKIKKKYSRDVILQKMRLTHAGDLDEKHAETLMTRGVEACPLEPKMFRFSRDYRVQHLLFQALSLGQVEFLMRNLKSDVLRIKATDGHKPNLEHITDNKQEWLTHNEDGSSKPNIVRYVTVQGNHYVHMADPKKVLAPIVVFLAEERNRSM